jgi:hypothetical protein
MFLGGGLMLHPARSAIVGHVTGVGHNATLDYRAVNIGGVDDGLIHMHDRGVIGKRSTAPLAAGKSDATVAEAVVHTAVVADMGAPIAVIKAVMAIGPAPVGRRPQCTLVGSRNPGSGHPIVVSIVI